MTLGQGTTTERLGCKPRQCGKFSCKHLQPLVDEIESIIALITRGTHERPQDRLHDSQQGVGSAVLENGEA